MKELERAQQMHRLVSEALVGDYATDVRGSLFASFVSVCMSHHEAITLLVMNGRLTGSALALCRPLVEAACRGMYVAYAADDKELESIAKGAEPYPPFKQLIAMLDARLSVGNLFTQYSEVWKSLNDFTHGGVFQLARALPKFVIAVLRTRCDRAENELRSDRRANRPVRRQRRYANGRLVNRSRLLVHN
jgi:hypothetical protein